MGEVRRGEVIALPARFGEASEELGGLTEGSLGQAPVVELLEFRSLARGAGRYATRVAAVAVSPDPASPWTEEIAALEARLWAQEESARAHVERARRDGQMEGQKAAEQEAERRVVEARTEVEQIAERFRLEHEQYFRRVEREVVRLALTIAARVLHREATMDPLLLEGAVRVALEKLADTSGPVLRTARGEVLAWQEMFRLTGEARIHFVREAAKASKRASSPRAAASCMPPPRPVRVMAGTPARLKGEV